MAAHRYWNARGFSVLQGRALSLSEFHLYAAASRVDTAATLTSNVAPSSGSLSSLSDDDVTTGVRWLSQEGVNLYWDFGSGGSADVDGVRVGSSAASSDEFPVFCSVWFSDDAVTWTRQADWAADYPGVQQKIAGFYNWQPNDVAVVSQLRFIGANGSTTFTDDVDGNVWTPSGSAQLKTDQFRWGGSAGFFNGTTDYISMPSRPGMNLGTTDFAIEVYFRVASFTKSYGTLVGNNIGTFVIPARFLMVYGDGAPTVFNRRKIGFGGEGSGFANPALLSTTVLTTGVWYRVRIIRIGPTMWMFVNDVLEATITSAAAIDLGFLGTRVGSNGWDGADSYFHGHIGEFRVTHTVGEDGSLPAYVRHPVPKKTNRMRVFQPEAKIATGVGLWPFTGATLTPAPVRARGDYLAGVLGQGIGRVKGTTKDKGSPNVPVSERVRLYREQDGLLIRELWSAPVTGAYSFDYVDELQTYTVVSYDHDKNFRAVVADGLSLAGGGVELIA